MTTCGPLDVLGQIGAGRGYAELLAESVVLPIGDRTVRVLGLPALIQSKVEAGRDKDRAVLAILRRALEESSRS